MKKTERSFKGLLKQWQEILEMIVKRLQLSETYNKVMEEVKTFESNLDRMTSGLKEPQQIFHCKEDLEKHIQSLKVSTILNAKYTSSNHATFQLHLLKDGTYIRYERARFTGLIYWLVYLTLSISFS